MGNATDRRNVTSTSDPSRHGIDGVLATLPPAYLVAGQADARFVVGPTGAFLLLPAGREHAAVALAADQLAALVNKTRNALCDHLTWVPFLDALLVTTADPPRGADVTVAPLDLVHDVLTEGPTVITLGTINAIRDVVRTARLDGWRVGKGEGASIDVRDPAQPSTTR
jgi:hypothetical protein